MLLEFLMVSGLYGLRFILVIGVEIGRPNVDDIVDQLRNLASALERNQGRSTVVAAADEIERLREWKLVADLFGVAFRVDEWGQYPPSNGDDVHKAVLAYERLKTMEARRG
jgi:hypothetical protein